MPLYFTSSAQIAYTLQEIFIVHHVKIIYLKKTEYSSEATGVYF